MRIIPSGIVISQAIKPGLAVTYGGDTAYNGYEDCNDIIWLIIDDEMAGYIKRVMGSFEVTDETISRKNPQLI